EAGFTLPAGGDEPQDTVEVIYELEDEEPEDVAIKPIIKVELPVAADALGTDEDVPEGPRLTFNTDIDVQEISPTRSTAGYIEIVAGGDADVGAASSGQAAGTQRAGSLTRIQGDHCGNLRLEGQHRCFHCGCFLTKGSRQSTFRMFMSRKRNDVLDQIAQETGYRLWQLTADQVRQGSGQHDNRGAQSVDGKAIAQAKQSLKHFRGQGHSGMLDKFDSDHNYAIYAVRNGWTRRLLSIQECVAFAYLPNPGRNREQRALGYGSSRRLEASQVDHTALCRMVYFDKPAGDLIQAGLLSNDQEEPIGFAWLGSFYGVEDVSRVAFFTRGVSHVLTFCEGTIELPHATEAGDIKIFLKAVVRDNHSAARTLVRQMKDDAEASRAPQRLADERRARQQERNAPRHEEADVWSSSTWGWSDHGTWWSGDWRSENRWSEWDWSSWQQDRHTPWRYDHSRRW
ncbi:unnamed protein product, partial [Symbiodinium natans]